MKISRLYLSVQIVVKSAPGSWLLKRNAIAVVGVKICELCGIEKCEMMPYEKHKEFWDELEEMWCKDSAERLVEDLKK